MVYSFIVAPMGRNRFLPRPSQELCPFETMEWEKLRTKWNCTDPADYHCLPDQYNVPGQICVKPIWVLKSKYINMVNHFPIRTPIPESLVEPYCFSVNHHVTRIDNNSIQEINSRNQTEYFSRLMSIVQKN